jgi:CTP-dependent riboflavin kinase
MMELRASSDVSQISHEISDVSRDVNHGAKVIQRNLEQQGKGLVDYVLKLLAEGPKTSRQIEIVIGRTREHTARLMKKLFELGYVTRDTATKPYTYSITEVGRAVLQQVASVNP